MKKAIIDIDGVLNTYPKTQIDYFNFMLDKDYKSLDEIKNDLSYNEYKYLKNQYRQSAFKHNCKASPGARKLYILFYFEVMVNTILNLIHVLIHYNKNYF